MINIWSTSGHRLRGIWWSSKDSLADQCGDVSHLACEHSRKRQGPQSDRSGVASATARGTQFAGQAPPVNVVGLTLLYPQHFVLAQQQPLPRTPLAPLATDVRIPILLLRRRPMVSRLAGGVHSNHGAADLGGGWDIVLPAGWANDIWKALVFGGARAGGAAGSGNPPAQLLLWLTTVAQYQDLWFGVPLRSPRIPVAAAGKRSALASVRCAYNGSLPRACATTR